MRAGRAGNMGPGATAVAVVASLSLLLAACGLAGGDDDAAGPASKSEQLRFPANLDAGDGCGSAAATNPADTAANRIVARCAPDAPAAQPLAQPAVVRVGVRERTEDLAPVLLADEFEEFAKENITVELSEFDTAVELYQALAAGQIDVVAGEIDAPFFDQAAAGAGARLALGGAVAASADDLTTPQAGFWVRTDLLSEPDEWMDLEDQEIAVEDGIGDAVAYPVHFLLEPADLSLNEVALVPIGSKEAARRLLNEELAGAWVADPYWRQLEDSDLPLELVATPPVGDSLGGVVLGPRLLDAAASRDVGLAFARAVIRTINTYLTGDYQNDDDVVAALADATGASREDITATPAWVFDWELREGVSQRVQEPFILLGSVLYEHELGEGALVDRTLYDDVVNAAAD